MAQSQAPEYAAGLLRDSRCVADILRVGSVFWSALVTAAAAWPGGAPALAARAEAVGIADALSTTHLRTLNLGHNLWTNDFARDRLLPAVRANTSLRHLTARAPDGHRQNEFLHEAEALVRGGAQRDSCAVRLAQLPSRGTPRTCAAQAASLQRA